MKKLIALLLAAVMALGMMIPGMAEPSPGKLDIQVVSYEISEGDQNLEVIVRRAEPTAYENSTVAELVEKVNNVTANKDAGSVITLADVANALSQLPANAENEIMALDDYDFVTDFYDVLIIDADGNVYADVGAEVKVTITLHIDALTDLDDDSDLSNYLLMLINPITGELLFLPLEEGEDGDVIVKLPFLGVFAIIQKV